MSKVRNLPETMIIDDADLIYVIDMSEGSNAGRKATINTLRTAVISQAQDIPYNNNDSTLTAINVKTALDELDDKVNEHDIRHLPDNSDGLVTAAPDTNLSPATTNSIGGANSFARSNHTHAVATALVANITTIQPDDSASAGTSDTFSRGDHKHAVITAAPITTLSPAISNSEGSGTSFTRNDHTHTIATALTANISTIQPDDAAAQGISDTYTRGDHKHAILTASASAITTSSTNTEGSSTSFARADHTHQSSVDNLSATATADDTTASLTDVLMVSMTQTPAAGTYFVMWSGSTVNSANGAERTFVSLYLNGAQVSATERSVGTSGAAYSPTVTQAIITTPGSQAIELRWRVAAGTSTVHSRRFTFIKLA